MAQRVSKATWNRMTASEKASLRAALAKKAAKTVSRKPRSTPARKPQKGRNWADVAATGLGYLAPAAGAYFGIPALTGLGDYAPIGHAPSTNSFMKAIMANGPPAIHNTRMRSFIMRHREYLGDVVTAPDSSFNVTSFAINPGLPASFPWLAQLAQNFEQYRVLGLVYEFKSTSADALNSTNTALGSVIMATEYNSDSAPFATKIQMENHEMANSCRQSCSMLHAVECKPSLTSISELYVRTDTPPDGQDLRLYDLGRFSIATVGQQGANVNIGELWVTYEIELLKPQLPDTSSVIAEDHVTCGSSYSTSHYFGNPVTYLKNSLGCTFSGNTITFPDDVASGTYLCLFLWRGASGAPTTNTVPACAYLNCSSVSNTFGNETLSFVSNTAEEDYLLVLAQYVQVDGLGATITLSGGTLPNTPQFGDFIIARVDGY